jgi:hypothetical protein
VWFVKKVEIANELRAESFEWVIDGRDEGFGLMNLWMRCCGDVGVAAAW